MKRDLISVVIPVYNEANTIKNNVLRVANILMKENISYEIILIDDGSKDNSWSEMERCIVEIPGIKAIKLSRNFGKENALCAGLDQVAGECCICLDADMQHPPEMIPAMYSLWKNEGFEVVEGVKSSRGKESLFYKISAGLFYQILKKTSGIDLSNASDFRLLDRKALEAWKQMPEKQTFFRGMSTWIGFSRTQIQFTVAEREVGESKWSIFKLIKFALGSITSYTAAPLYASAFIGFTLLIAFLFLLFQTVVMKLLGYAADGFTTVIALQLVIGGVLMMSVGVIGIYIEKIYEEVKSRPRYIIQKAFDGQKISSASVESEEGK